MLIVPAANEMGMRKLQEWRKATRPTGMPTASGGSPPSLASYGSDMTSTPVPYCELYDEDALQASHLRRIQCKFRIKEHDEARDPLIVPMFS